MSIYRWAKLDDQSGPDRSIELRWGRKRDNGSRSRAARPRAKVRNGYGVLVFGFLPSASPCQAAGRCSWCRWFSWRVLLVITRTSPVLAERVDVSRREGVRGARTMGEFTPPTPATPALPAPCAP